MKKFNSAILFFSILLSNTLSAQDLDVSSKASSFYEVTIKPLFPIVLGIVFVITGLMNIGLIMDEQNRNWKAFLTRILMFVGGALLLMVVVNFLATLTI